MNQKNNEVLTAPMMIKRYLSQPVQLPHELKNKIDSKILLYAFVDLNESYQLINSWAVLTEKELIYAVQDGEDYQLKSILRNDVKKAHEVQGLSANKLVVIDNEDKTLMQFRVSHRQMRMLSLIKFALEKEISAPSKSSDDVYVENTLHSLKEAQSSVSGNQSDVVVRLLKLLKPYKKQLAFGMAGAFLMTMVSLVPAYITGSLIDNVIKPFQSGAITMDKAKELSILMIAMLVLMYLMREFFAWVRLRTMSMLGEQIAKDLRDKVYAHLHKLSLSFFSSKQTGSIISRVGSDTDRIWDFIAFGVVEVTTSILMLTGLGIVLTTLDWRLGLIVTLPVPFLLYVIFRHGQQMQQLFLRAWRKWSNLTDCISDTVPGIRVVKAFNREAFETQRFLDRNDATLQEFQRIHRTWTSFWPLLMLSIQGIVVTVWIFGVPRVLENISYIGTTNEGLGLTPGVFVSFVLYLGMFIHPIEIIGQMARMINRATSSAHRVFEVLDTEPQILQTNEPKAIEDVKGHVVFQNVNFSYDGVRKILKNINFEVQPGEMIGLVGASGSGKTTMINLLARFYDIQGGNILIDGEPIKELELGTYRQQLGMVLQDPYLFHGSILQNIRYANPEAAMEEVIEAAVAANAHDFICKLTHGYDTIVGERGHTLSGGERQRVSIARAILRNPKILILDEATSAVDTETEKKIQQALDRLISGRTTFAIAHRLSTLAQADRLFVMDNGAMVEHGTHQELYANKEGVYHKLVSLQQQLHENRLV